MDESAVEAMSLATRGPFPDEYDEVCRRTGVQTDDHKRSVCVPAFSFNFKSGMPKLITIRL